MGNSETKTAIEWFNTVGDLILRDLLIERDLGICKRKKYESLSSALHSSFFWDSTPEGFDYWRKYYRLISANGQ